MQTQSSQNFLYETKKSLLSRTGSQPPSQLYENPKRQIDELRNQLRRRESDIIRLKSRVQQLTNELKNAQSVQKISAGLMLDSQRKAGDDLGRVNFLVENKSLKDECQQLRNQNFTLNGMKNDIERQLRETRSELQHRDRKMRDIQIIERMRQERFEDELNIAKDTLATADIPQGEDSEELKQGTRAVIDFVRQGVCQTIFDIFINSANQSEKRKTSSLIVFKGSLNQLRKSKRNCVLLSCRTYMQFKKLVRLYDDSYGQIEQDMNEQPRDKFNRWLANSLLEVTKGKQIKKTGNLEEVEMMLFRLLALYYRVKYPLKGQKDISIDEDLRIQLQSSICESLQSVLVVQI